MVQRHKNLTPIKTNMKKGDDVTDFHTGRNNEVFQDDRRHSNNRCATGTHNHKNIRRFFSFLSTILGRLVEITITPYYIISNQETKKFMMEQCANASIATSVLCDEVSTMLSVSIISIENQLR